MDNLEDLRKKYILTQVPEKIEREGWFKLAQKLDKRIDHYSLNYAKITLASLSLFLLSSGAVIAAAQKATPDQSLYPIKITQENVLVTITGSKNIKMQNRAQEVVALAKENKKDLLQKAAEDYEKTVQDAKKNINSEQERDFEKHLRQQREEFSQSLEDSPEAKEELEKAIEATQKGENDDDDDDDDVKGVKRGKEDEREKKDD